MTKAKNKISKQGFTLIETLIGLLILIIVLVSIYGIFRLAFKSIGKSEARISASNLANQRMETIRNMAYNDLGTTEGWPRGDIPSSEIVNLNNINYTIHTDIQYVDDELDGLAPSDTYNADYKRVRVWVDWDKYSATKIPILVTDIAPRGIESPVGGGTLSLTVINALAEVVPSVSVHIENTNLTPNILINTQTNAQGQLIVPALPEDTGNNYSIRVSKSGYTSDYTSAITPEMPDPLLPHQSITEGAVTSVTFTIDLVSTMNISSIDDTGTSSWWNSDYAYRRQLTITNNSPDTALPETPVKYSLDHFSLVSDGKSQEDGDDIRIVYFDGSSFVELDRINETSWNIEGTATQIWFDIQAEINPSGFDNNYYLYYGNSTVINPPSDQTIGEDLGLLVGEGEEISYEAPGPISDIPIYIVGERILGFDGEGNPILRNEFTGYSTDSSGQLSLENIEWDNYTISEESSDYDLKEIDPPNPVSLAPEETKDVTITLVPHADHTLHVTVKNAAGDPISSASVRLYSTSLGFDETQTTSPAGQVFFTPLTMGIYNLDVSATGYGSSSDTQEVTGQTEREVILSST